MSQRMEHARQQIAKLEKKYQALMDKHGSETSWRRSVRIKAQDILYWLEKHTDYVATHRERKSIL